MKVRKFRILRLRYHISMVELGRACGVSAQRISELELGESTPEAETAQKIQTGFETIIARRREKLDTLQQEYIACKNSLMERVGEYEYEL